MPMLLAQDVKTDRSRCPWVWSRFLTVLVVLGKNQFFNWLSAFISRSLLVLTPKILHFTSPATPG